MRLTSGCCGAGPPRPGASLGRAAEQAVPQLPAARLVAVEGASDHIQAELRREGRHGRHPCAVDCRYPGTERRWHRARDPRCGRWGNAPGEGGDPSGPGVLSSSWRLRPSRGCRLAIPSSSSYRPAPRCSRLTTRITKGITFQVIETVLDTRYPSSPRPRTRCLWHWPEARQGGERQGNSGKEGVSMDVPTVVANTLTFNTNTFVHPAPPGALRRRPREAPQ